MRLGMQLSRRRAKLAATLSVIAVTLRYVRILTSSFLNGSGASTYKCECAMKFMIRALYLSGNANCYPLTYCYLLSLTIIYLAVVYTASTHSSPNFDMSPSVASSSVIDLEDLLHIEQT
jgi:hypothetical protein